MKGPEDYELDYGVDDLFDDYDDEEDEEEESDEELDEYDEYGYSEELDDE